MRGNDGSAARAAGLFPEPSAEWPQMRPAGVPSPPRAQMAAHKASGEDRATADEDDVPSRLVGGWYHGRRPRPSRRRGARAWRGWRGLLYEASVTGGENSRGVWRLQ